MTELELKLECQITINEKWMKKFKFPMWLNWAIEFPSTMNHLKGARGGSMTLGRSNLLLFLTEGSVSYQMLFTRSKNIVPSRSYWILKS